MDVVFWWEVGILVLRVGGKADRGGGWGCGRKAISGLFSPRLLCFALLWRFGWAGAVVSAVWAVGLTADSDNTVHRTPTRQWVQRTTAALSVAASACACPAHKVAFWGFSGWDEHLTGYNVPQTW